MRKQNDVPIVNEIVRIDRNLVNYSEVFVQNYQDDANLVMSVLGFILSKLRNNLFNFTTFTLTEFCQKYNYRKEHLTKIHPLFKDIIDEELSKKPKKGEVRPYIDKANGHVYKNVFDHVLYRMLKENIVFSSEIADDKLKYVSSQRSIQLFKRIVIKNKATRKGAEGYVYEVTLGDELFNNLFRYYVTFHENKFIALGKGKSAVNKRGLYFYLLQQYNRCLASKIPTNIVTPNFNFLCKIAGLSNSKVRNNKQTLIKYLDLLGNENFMGFTHNLKRVDLDDPDFRIIIEFKRVEHFEDYNVQQFFNKLIKHLEEYFLSTRYDKFSDADKDELYWEKLQLWINDHSSDLTDKCRLLKEIYKKSFGKDLHLDVAKKVILTSSWSDIID